MWQLIVAAGYAVHLPGYDTEFSIVWLTAIGLVLAGFAVVHLYRTLSSPDRDASIAFALLPVGAHALLVSPYWLAVGSSANRFEGTQPVYGSLWSYVNGMETPLVLFAFAGTWRHFVHSAWTPARAARAGVWLALLTFARLDHVLVALPFALLGAKLANDRRVTAYMLAT